MLELDPPPEPAGQALAANNQRATQGHEFRWDTGQHNGLKQHQAGIQESGRIFLLMTGRQAAVGAHDGRMGTVRKVCRGEGPDGLGAGAGHWD